jgi:hypothetical protein
MTTKVHYKWVYLNNKLEYNKLVQPFKGKDRFGPFEGAAYYFCKVGTGKERFIYIYTAEQRVEEIEMAMKSLNKELNIAKGYQNAHKAMCLPKLDAR